MKTIINTSKTILLTLTKTKKMKKQILTIAFALVGTFAMAQNQFMTWSHNGGHTPSAYLTVDCNEIFEFHNVGFQTHPVDEGGFGPSTDPNYWPSQGLTLLPSQGPSNPMLLSIPTAGTYNFRCGSNPTKQSLWGQITVTGPGCSTVTPTWECIAGSCVDPGTGNGAYTLLSACTDECSTTYVEQGQSIKFSVYPNPATDILTVEGLNGIAEIFDVNGKKVMDVTSVKVNVSTLAKGTYIIKTEDFKTIFIKE